MNVAAAIKILGFVFVELKAVIINKSPGNKKMTNNLQYMSEARVNRAIKYMNEISQIHKIEEFSHRFIDLDSSQKYDLSILLSFLSKYLSNQLTNEKKEIKNGDNYKADILSIK